MTWLDKGLRRVWRPAICRPPGGAFDMTWLDKGLRPDPAPLPAMLWRFDMTWLDKGLRRPLHEARLRAHAWSLIWPDLIRDYDSMFSRITSAHSSFGLIWPDLIRDYDARDNLAARGVLNEGLIWSDLIRDYDNPGSVLAPIYRRTVWYDLTW